MRGLILGALAAALVLGSVATPQASEPHGISCRLTGVMNFKPALTAAPRETKITFMGHMTHCVTPGDVDSGDMHATATSTGGCSYGDTEGVIEVEWSDKTATTMAFTAESFGPFAVLHGEASKSNSSVVHKGDPIGGVLSIDADPARCASGIRTATMQGQGFGGNAP